MTKNKLRKKKYTKYLGVLLNNCLCWGKYISYLNLKLTWGIGILTKLGKIAFKDILKSLYLAIVQPHINYGLILIMGYYYQLNQTKNRTKLEELYLMLRELNILTFFKQDMCYWYYCFSSCGNFNNIPENTSGSFQLRHKIYCADNLKHLVM